jgi:two-component system sensor histidine kinase UhpB
MSLRLQLNLIITALIGVFAALLITLQIQNTRSSVHDEIVGSNAVAVQLLSRLGWIYEREGLAGIESFLQSLGRIRANEITLYSAEGAPLYRSPPSTYKAGRYAPAFYANWVSEDLPAKTIQLPTATLVLKADPSRAVLDGWDDLQPLLLTGLAGFLIGNFLVFALVGHALVPLEKLKTALHQMELGAYQTRLPELKGLEARRMGQAFNRMAQAVAEKNEAQLSAQAARQALAENRELAQWVHHRVEEERSAIARELHDELGQQITAIKSVGTSIARRAEGVDPKTLELAHWLVACSDDIYGGMHRLIARLNPPALEEFGFAEALADLVDDWRLRQTEVRIELETKGDLSRLNSDHAHAAYRIAQEALNNAFKHAQAKHIRIEATLQASLNPEQADTFKLSITDDGVGRQDKAIDPSRWGIKGMQERVQALGGHWALHDHEPQGLTLVAMWEVA